MRFDGFDWDGGNRRKCQKHGVSIGTIEDLFKRPVIIIPDPSHSTAEQRFRGIGRAEDGRGLFVVFTLRRRGPDILLRPISVRYMHTDEITSYEEENPDV